MRRKHRRRPVEESNLIRIECSRTRRSGPEVNSGGMQLIAQERENRMPAEGRELVPFGELYHVFFFWFVYFILLV